MGQKKGKETFRRGMMIYNIFIHLVFIILSPVFLFYYFFEPERFGWKTEKKKYWVHAASVGEINMLGNIIKNLTGDIIITTMTNTGKKRAKELYPEYEAKLIPFDFPLFLREAIEKSRPEMVIIAECELWPNFIRLLKRIGARIVIINGRIESTRYKRFKWLIKGTVDRIDRVFAAGRENVKRFVEIGIPREKIEIVNNLKYDVIPVLKPIKKQFYILKDKPLFVCGSTHSGEEEIIVKNLLKNVVTIIAPRHLYRVREIETLLKKNGVYYTKYSTGIYNGENVVVLDTIGDLPSFYSIADLVMIGGTLAPVGGHNPVEATIFGKPIIFGSYVFSIDEFAQALVKGGAATIVDRENFGRTINSLFRNLKKRKDMGKKAAEITKKFTGSTQKILKEINDYRHW